MDGVGLARAHGVANLAGGLWPLLHLRSFEMVFGPKTDRWLVKTVAGLLIVNGITQLATSSSADSMRQARRLGVGTAAVLAAVDMIYVSAGQISKMYLVDAAVEVAWIMAWYQADVPAPTATGNS
ncbi:MAG: hypothetical protein K0R13_2880 [Propionibacteriaceae bacterium]|jgi:hypothetical protein|nr:hypothetical protein [Propionibacteriaceae bacterium]